MSAFRATRIAALFTCLIGAASAQDVARPLLSPVFQDHAVIQRDRTIPVWGDAVPGTAVTLDLAGHHATATADADGTWKATLPALPAGGPYTLSASAGGKSQTVSDILIGDVYLCSGQSNMEMPVHVVSNYDNDLKGASNTQIRLMHVERFSAASAQSRFGNTVTWAVTSPDSVRDYSAACYYFGRELQPDVNVPLGLIESAWGGTAIQSWLPSESLRALGYGPDLDILAAYLRDPSSAKAQWQAVIDRWWREHDPATKAATPWSDPSFDDSDWSRIVPAGAWEGWGLEALRNFDGSLWLRKHVVLSAEQAKGDITLTLGPVDDYDTVFINGRHVGSGEGWDEPRRYTVPAGLMHAGDNLIAVGVLDTGAGGGMWGTASDKALIFADGSKMLLDTPWRWHISGNVAATGSLPHAPWNGSSGLGMLYNGMIAPLGDIRIKAMLWYQGESNTGESVSYGALLKRLIVSWRERFGADTPFITVQLPGYGPQVSRPFDSVWAVLREQQRLATASQRNSYLAVTIDLGQRDNIHPTDKQNVGRRLALIAKKYLYGMDVVADGPRPLSATRHKGTVRVAFDQPLRIVEAARPIAFQLCDGAGACRFADARARGDTVLIDAKAMPKAREVRFCWSDSPLCNLYNAAGLPAVPFRLPIGTAAAPHA